MQFCEHTDVDGHQHLSFPGASDGKPVSQSIGEEWGVRLCAKHPVDLTLRFQPARLAVPRETAPLGDEISGFGDPRSPGRL